MAILAAGREGRRGLQGLRPGQNSTARTMEQFVDIPVPQGRGGEEGGGLQGSRPEPVSTSSSSHSPGVDEAFIGFFALFPNQNKVRGWVRTRGRNWVRTFNPRTPAAYADSMALEEDELGMESESESEPEEDVVTRSADGFRPLRVCMRFLELHMGRPVRECACGDWCTFAHSWAELYLEASAHECELASYCPE